MNKSCIHIAFKPQYCDWTTVNPNMRVETDKCNTKRTMTDKEMIKTFINFILSNAIFRNIAKVWLRLALISAEVDSDLKSLDNYLRKVPSKCDFMRLLKYAERQYCMISCELRRFEVIWGERKTVSCQFKTKMLGPELIQSKNHFVSGSHMESMNHLAILGLKVLGRICNCL